ncbi:peroxiredoxin-2-like [Curcuma longa]|uniref:peroxiredoxin-2-like n=1 Tax=Curcuma longa TaxID=136217 RepID=UPI003D9EDC26
MPLIGVGNALPDGELSWLDERNQLHMISVHSLAAGKKVVLFGGPGAFTPICNMKFVPGFIGNVEEFKSKGVDEILLISVNDPYVMKAWAQSYPENEHVKFLADDSGIYTHKLGLEIHLSDKRLGTRSHRFVLLVDDLVVKATRIEIGPLGIRENAE